MVDCNFFEVIDWDENTEKIIHAVCTMPSPCWPNCGSCTDKEQFTMPGDHSLISSAIEDLTQGDVDILSGSINRRVRMNPANDVEVKRLYNIWKSL